MVDEKNSKIKGKFVGQSGEIFEGLFENDKMSEGKLILKDGSVHVGEFIGGKVTGKGKVSHSFSFLPSSEPTCFTIVYMYRELMQITEIRTLETGLIINALDMVYTSGLMVS